MRRTQKKPIKSPPWNGGFVLIGTVILMGTLLLIGSALLSMADHNFIDASIQRDEVQAFYLAETGVEEAIWYLQNVDTTWVGDSPQEHSMNNGTYTIAIDHSSSPTLVITVTGYVPNLSNVQAKKTLEVTGNLS